MKNILNKIILEEPLIIPDKTPNPILDQLTEEEALACLIPHYDYQDTGKKIFVYNGKFYNTPEELGLNFCSESSQCGLCWFEVIKIYYKIMKGDY